MAAGERAVPAEAEKPQGDSSGQSIVADLMKNVPADFPRFSFEGHAEQADLLTHYLWYHFHHRLGNGLTLFNQEYLLTSDIWLGNARPRGSDQTIQEVHRSMLLGMQMDDEGYVLTHQHFSHAHDHGWPFPLWTQSDNHPDRVKGKTFGWHFQPLDKVPGWVGDALRHWGRDEYCGEKAASLWELHNVRSLGIKENRWHLEAEGPSPTILTPKGYAIDAFNAPVSATAMDSYGRSEGPCVALCRMAVRGRRRVRAGPSRLLRSREDAFVPRLLSLDPAHVSPSEVDRPDRTDSHRSGPGRSRRGISRSIRSSPPTTRATRSTTPSSSWPVRGTSTGPATWISCDSRSIACDWPCAISRP